MRKDYIYICEFVKINILKKDQQFFTHGSMIFAFGMTTMDSIMVLSVKLAYYFVKTHEILRTF